MFCTNCGAQLPDGSKTCSKCNISFQSISRAESGIIKGLIILSLSFITMPLKTLKITVVLLREVGGKGKLDVGTTDIPPLTWLAIAGYASVSATILGIMTISIIWGLTSLGQLDESVGDAIKGLIFRPIIGIAIAIAADWLLMIANELILLLSGIANDVKKIVQKP